MTKIIIPPIVGYIVFRLFDSFLEIPFPTFPLDDSSIPGLAFLIEYILLFLWIICVIGIQYKVVVPRTRNSIRKLAVISLTIGFILGLIFGAGHFWVDNGTTEASLISGFRIFIQFAAFTLANLLTIKIINLMVKNRLKRVPTK